MAFFSPLRSLVGGRGIPGLGVILCLIFPPSFPEVSLGLPSKSLVAETLTPVHAVSKWAIWERAILPSSLAGDSPDRPKIPPAPLLDLSGHSVSVQSLVGHPLLLVSLMATWCRPCLEEIPSLVALSRRMGGRLALAGIVEGAADRSVLEGINRRYGKAYLLRLDPTMRFASGLHAHALPESFLIDAQGKVVSRVEGQVDWTDPRVVRYLESFLEKKAGT